MPRSRLNARRRLLNAAYERFFRDGFLRSGVDGIAETAEVTKQTLYSHFESKDALLAAVLEDRHPQVLERIERWAGNAETVEEFVASLFKALRDWAESPGWRGSGFTRVALELAGLPGHPARRVARRHKAALEDWLQGRLHALNLPDSRNAARRLQIILEGAMVLTLIHGDVGYVEAGLETAAMSVVTVPAADGAGDREGGDFDVAPR